MHSRFSMYLCILIHSMHSMFSMYLCILLHSRHSRLSNMLVYIDVLELFVYINLPLLMRSRFSMCSRRLFKSTLYHVLMQFGRRSSRLIATPIDSAQSMYSFSTPVYYLYTRAVLCTRSQLCSHLKICFTPISLSSSFLLQLDLYVYTRLPRAAAPPIDVNIYANTLHRSTGVRVGLGNAIFV